MAGFRTLEVKSTAAGLADLGDLAAKLDERTAVFMITNPNTLGLFDRQIGQIAEMVHASAAWSISTGRQHERDPGDCPARRLRRDMMHFNPHKTFSGPHGGGGPGRADRDYSRQAALLAAARGETGRSLHPRLRPPQVDRPGAELFREHGSARADLLLPADARSEGLRRGGECRAQRELSPQPGKGLPPGPAWRPLHARVCRLGPETEGRARRHGDGRGQAAARLRIPRRPSTSR